ncbi:ATPase [Frigidibacter sp. RF13]|uniref:ATP12 family chaperone protein n=1 Tax=Frigidibacter sp. RF13 TaxID=2997340 RepID=UPI00226DECE5|nr:ATP12 family protein [Frigidibacter sp. RF13]MCY1127446.1 ATPase [Frigidibacter sp. RF13]
MSGWKAKRFWKDVTVHAVDGGFEVNADGRVLKTPAKAALRLPTSAMAEAVAAEWRAVEETVDPRLMPVTRAANAAIDKVAQQFDEVAEMIAAYGASDLLCYRAEAPAALRLAQAKVWDPMLDWAERALGARLVTTTGVVPVQQPAGALGKLSRKVRETTPFQLTALHDLVSLSGSLILGLAAATDEFDVANLWEMSRFDEEWQARQWGEDEEASVIAEKKRTDFLRARHFWELCS